MGFDRKTCVKESMVLYEIFSENMKPTDLKSTHVNPKKPRTCHFSISFDVLGDLRFNAMLISVPIGINRSRKTLKYLINLLLDNKIVYVPEIGYNRGSPFYERTAVINEFYRLRDIKIGTIKQNQDFFYKIPYTTWINSYPEYEYEDDEDDDYDPYETETDPALLAYRYYCDKME